MKKLFLLFFLFSILIFFNAIPVYAECDNLCQELQKKTAQIEELEKQLSQVKGQEKSLKSQLDLIDGQTKVTSLKIEETNLKIQKLKREINDLSSRIDRISGSLDTLSEILLKRIIQTYKYGNAVSTIDLMFSSHGFAELLERLKYIQVAQAYDKKKLYELQATKIAYNEQKQDKQTRQADAEKLQKDLAVYQSQLAQQKKDKDELLRITKNDEIRYQQEITRLRADAQAILNAISNIGVKIGDVNKGDVIAYQGNTGCVSPPPPGGHHLHFEVYKDAKVSGGAIVDVNSGQNIQFKYGEHLVNPRNYLDNGQWAKPLSIYPGGVTMEFGKSSFFGPHTGIDIAGPLGSTIHAADKGVVYIAGGSVCDSQMGYKPGTTTPARGRVVDHQNGFVTLYWHTTN